VDGLDGYWRIKSTPSPATPPAYVDVHLPTNSPVGFVIAFFAAIGGFAMIWHIWWLVAIGLVGAIGTLIASSWDEHDEIRLSAEKVAELERRARASVRA
jgi:cytochrome o ubiquinol oxidase subunit 1